MLFGNKSVRLPVDIILRNESDLANMTVIRDGTRVRIAIRTLVIVSSELITTGTEDTLLLKIGSGKSNRNHETDEDLMVNLVEPDEGMDKLAKVSIILRHY